MFPLINKQETGVNLRRIMDMCTQKVLKQEVIVLPVKKDASPDWEYMEEYMKKMEKTAVERMNLLI